MDDEDLIIPGLADGDLAEDPSNEAANVDSLDLAAAIDAIEDGDLQSMIDEATMAYENGSTIDLVEQAPAPDDVEDEMGEGAPPEPSASDIGPQDPATVVDHVSNVLTEALALQDKLTALSEVNDASAEDDVVEIEEALEVVVAAVSEIEEAVATAETAAADMDPDASAEAVEAANDALKRAKEAVEKAEGAAKETAGAIETEEPDAWTTWADSV